MLRFLEIVLAAIVSLYLVGTVVAQQDPPQSEKATGPAAAKAEQAEREKRLTAATDAAKELLLLMDTDQSGKVSKQEWMKFMEDEFDRLDADHNGELDVKELTQSRVRMHPAIGK